MDDIIKTFSLFAAVRDGDLHTVKMYVELLSKDEAKLMISVVHVGGLTLMAMACRGGHVDVVEYLIDECGADVEQAEAMGWGGTSENAAPPLWWASTFRHLNVVKSLVSRGANVNSVGKLGLSPLHMACFNAELEMVKYLIANGADIEAADVNGTTCLSIACQGNHYQTAYYLMQLDINGLLILKSLLSLAEMFTKMLSEGESVDFEVIMTVFKLAVDNIEAQIKRGDKIVEDDIVLNLIGCMARMKPEQNKSFVEVVRRYVSLNRRESYGVTPLHVVCGLHAHGSAEVCPYSVVNVVKVLLDAGADPQAVDIDLNAPLHVLAEARPISLEVIRLLLDRGAHFDARNADGKCFLDLVAPEDRAQLNALEYTTLKCLAAQTLKKSNMQYQDQLPKSLVNFVKLH